MERVEYKEHSQKLAEQINVKNLNIVIGTTEAGAGHLRQMTHLDNYLNWLGLEDRITKVVFPGEKSGSLLGFWQAMYSWMQKKPKMWEATSTLMESKLLLKYIQKQVKDIGQPEFLNEQISGSTHFEPSRDTLWVSTHVTAAVSMAEMNGGLVEFIPDPWRNGQLAAMSNPYPLYKRQMTILHDNATADEYHRIIPNQKGLGLGTLSNHRFAVENPEMRPPVNENYWCIEFSGNPIPPYDELAARFIKAEAKQIKNGDFKLKIHTMHHSDTYGRIVQAVNEANLADCPNIRIVKEENIRDAIASREQMIIGDDDWGRPGVFVSKGGEVPLEQRDDRQTVLGVYGAGHEGNDIVTGATEGRAIDFRIVPPESWRGEWINRKNVHEQLKRVQSLAVLGLLWAVDRDYFQQHITC